MGNVCVITGGGSGMGLEAAKILGKNSKIILVGRTVSKLDKALAELKTLCYKRGRNHQYRRGVCRNYGRRQLYSECFLHVGLYAS